jgi:hypothetical protein
MTRYGSVIEEMARLLGQRMGGNNSHKAGRRIAPSGAHDNLEKADNLAEAVKQIPAPMKGPQFKTNDAVSPQRPACWATGCSSLDHAMGLTDDQGENRRNDRGSDEVLNHFSSPANLGPQVSRHAAA